MRLSFVAGLLCLVAAALPACTCFEAVVERDPPDTGPSGLDAGHGGPDASGPADAGAPGDAFCSGDEARVQRGATISPLVTTGSLRFYDCCEASELYLHTKDALGDNGHLDLRGSPGGRYPVGEVVVGDDPKQELMVAMTLGATLFGSGMSAAGPRISGTLEIDQADYSAPLTARFCLTLKFPGDPNDGVRFYAPAAKVMALGWNERFAIYLLKDRTIDAAAAGKLALGSLVLADQPLLDLFGIRYYRRGDHFVAFDLSPQLAAIKSQIGTVPLQGAPFVVVADGNRVYLGAFWTELSSFSPAAPFVRVEGMTTQGMTIELPAGAKDPRADARIVDALTGAAKLAP